MAESTSTTAITMAPGFISSTTKIVDYSTGYTPSSMEDIDLEDAEIATPIILASHTSSPIPLKGAKNNIMMGASPVPHPLSLSMDNNSFHRFQSDNSLYTHSNSALIHAALGPVSSSSPSCYSTSTVPSSATAAFMAMHGHNTSLYEPSRRNSVPTLTADQAEHKRKTCSEEKTLQRQASWTCFHTSSPISGLHQAEATHVDPTAMYRSQLQQQNGQQSSHSLSQVMPGSTNSSACPSPMPESFMPGSVLSNLNSSSTDDESPVSESGGAKVKRNNSICSTTSVSSTGSGSSNKHPCRFASCGWSFKRYEHLKRHMLVHSKERSFVCDVTGCNKSFSRSDNFSAHLRTHSKKSSDYRRRSSRVPDSTSSSNDIVQQEDLDIHLDSSASSLDQHNSESGFGSGSMSQEPSESGRDSSPARSPIGTPLKEDETFGMLGSSGYPFGNTMYSMDPMDPMDPLSGMVPRFDTIRLDLKSVAPSDIHRQSYADDQHSQVLLSAGNPNVESPHPSPIPHYEQFTFPSSISTHFMPIMHGGFPLDPTSLQQQHQQHQQQNQIQQSPMHIPSPSSSYSPMPSADSSSSSAATLHPGYPMEHDLRSLQFANVAGLHFAATSPLNEDGPIPTFHPHSPFQTHTHLDFYDTKVATPQMLHHTFPQLHSPSPAALPPHPLMPTATFSAPGLNEPLYSNPPMSSSTPTSLVAPRATPQPSVNMDSTPTNKPTALPSSNAHSLSDFAIPAPTLASQHHPRLSMMRAMSTSSNYPDGFSSPSLYSPQYLDTHSMSSSSSLSTLGNSATTVPDLNVNGTPSNPVASANLSAGANSSTNTSGNGSGGNSNSSGSGSSGNGNSSGSSKHGGSGKHHTCSVIGCSKRFKRLEHLKRHIKTHTLERPFNCPYQTCTKRFSRSDNLAQHVKTHQRQLNKLQMKHRSQAQAQAQAQQV